MTDDLDHVLWIGGMTGGGKTTVARRLAQRWGLRLYSSDNWTWVHRDRAIAAGVEAAIRFESLTPAQRDLVSADERAAMWLGSERAAMVVDDVRALPRVPIVVAEGGVISPDVIPPTNAVWLAPTEKFQLQHRLVDWLAIGFSADAARRCGIPTVAVDGRRSVQDVVDDVERAFAEHLTAGPLASSNQDRRKLLRDANLAGVAQVRDGCARPWATADPEVQLRSFVCECASPECQSDVEVTVAAAAAGPVFADGHQSPDSPAGRSPAILEPGFGDTPAALRRRPFWDAFCLDRRRQTRFGLPP